MPYLQVDVPRAYPIEVKRDFARRLAETFAKMMDIQLTRVSVAIRELGDGGLWRFDDENEPYQAAILMCDIRRGRPPEQRAALGAAFVELCMTKLGLEKNEINIEFTQHAGDEMCHPMLGGLSEDWSTDERSESGAD